MKKKPHWYESYTRWWKQVVISIVVIPALALSWKHMQNLWASPDRVEKVEKKVLTAEEVQANLSKLVMELEARSEKNEAMDDLRAKNQEQQLQLIAQLKAKK